MPTETRSSNTEQMVSDNQREWLKTMADAIQHADGKPMPVDPIVADLLRTLIAQPATQPLGWVYDGGQEFTSDPDLAHDLRAEGIELTAVYGHAQHQGEPVALPARKQWGGLLPTAENLRTEGWNAYNDEMAKLGPLYSRPVQDEPVGEVVAFGHGLHEIARAQGKMPSLGAKLYTHADADADEIERLRKDVARKTDCYQVERAKGTELRAQLDEAHALLRGIHDGEISGFERYSKIEALLSASAEPSAPRSNARNFYRHRTANPVDCEDCVDSGIEPCAKHATIKP